MTTKTVRIGGASGAWGDSPVAVPQLLTANIDYLIMDFLAEVTMSLLAAARLKDSTAGFPPDFVADIRDSLPEIKRRGIKLATNAGGVNPRACQAALAAAAEAAGLSFKIAVVEGDDVMPLIDSLRKEGDIRDADTARTLPEKLLTANAYLGAAPIKAAFDAGADIVITGRCADSALALGILTHEFGWSEDDYDKLAAGSLVGHVLECGPQATGGIHTDWENVPGWENIGYPIAECRFDGTFRVSKPEGTGGLINAAVVSEQILYEIGNPSAYFLPDVVADFSSVRVDQKGKDCVEVSGAKGWPASDTYKVSATYPDGYRAIAAIAVIGPDAVRKAERNAAALLSRSRSEFAKMGLGDFSATHVETLGAEVSYAGAARMQATREILLRVVVEHSNRKALERFAKEVGSTALAFSPGIAGFLGGRPRITPVLRLFTFFVKKAEMPAPAVSLDGKQFPIAVKAGKPVIPARVPVGQTAPPAEGPVVDVPLVQLAYARSGDKGNSSNIAIIARRPEFLPLIRREVTPTRMLEHFAGLVKGPVERYEAPGLNALNFLMSNALGGGGIASMRIDPQGKAFGQMALEMIIPVPRSWVDQGLLKDGRSL